MLLKWKLVSRLVGVVQAAKLETLRVASDKMYLSYEDIRIKY